MVDLNDLRKFLVEAKKSTYASGDVIRIINEKDSSKTILYEEGDWRYHDNYFGGEPYGGREIVFFKDTIVYIMVYYGYVNEEISEIETIYKTLQEALLRIPEEKPFRGPCNLYLNDFEYKNKSEGDISRFSGEETIQTIEGIVIYRAKYVGGLVNQR